MRTREVMFCFVHSNCKQRPDLGHETRVCFHAVYLCQYQCAKILIPVWDVKHVSVFTLYLCQYHCTEILIADLRHETRVCFTLYVVSVPLRSSSSCGSGHTVVVSAGAVVVL